jgi:UPF0271 protein
VNELDLNADLGEGMPGDAALLDIVSSAAGTPATRRRCG